MANIVSQERKPDTGRPVTVIENLFQLLRTEISRVLTMMSTTYHLHISASPELYYFHKSRVIHKFKEGQCKATFSRNSHVGLACFTHYIRKNLIFFLNENMESPMEKEAVKNDEILQWGL